MWRTPKAIVSSAPRTTHHQACMNCDSPMTITVKAGSSAPKPLKTDSNCGTTLTSRIPVTIAATNTTTSG
ncbi:hypothetical protein D3C75_1081060 [compost metagenome]